MQQHRYAVGVDAEEPARLDDLEAFVDQSGGVYGYLGAHRPLRVVQRLLGGNVGQRLARQLAQSAAAACYDKPSYGRTLARQTLQYGRVLRVDRNYRHASSHGALHDRLARYHERLLVGQRDLLAGLYGREGGVQTGIADQCVDHHVDLRRRSRGGDRVVAGEYFYLCAAQCRGQILVTLLVAYDDRIGVELHGLPCEQLPVAVRRERRYFEHVGVLAHYVERLHADRAGRPQNG